MPLSFLVPNISMTITSTINQCQMLSEPIIFSKEGVGPQFQCSVQSMRQAAQRGDISLPCYDAVDGLTLPTPWFGTADDMHMEMVHLLTAIRSGIEQRFESP